MRNIAEIEKRIEYTFQDRSLLVQALTHPSKKLEGKEVKSYQRLEFLGDKILNFIIAAQLFLDFPNESEGLISRRHAHLVAGSVCGKIAQTLDINKYVMFSKAQASDSTYNQITVGSDVIESIIGAIFLDGGLECATNFILSHWMKYIEADVNAPKDVKSMLQEYFQKHIKTLPRYELVSEENYFRASIEVHGVVYSGLGSSKKDAEKAAALEAIQGLSTLGR